MTEQEQGEPKPYVRPARIGMDPWPHYREPETTANRNLIQEEIPTDETVPEGEPESLAGAIEELLRLQNDR